MKEECAEYLESRWEEWGEWFAKYEDNGLGYPSQSINVNGILLKGIGRKIPPCNPNAEEIENWVMLLSRDECPKCAQVIRDRYFLRSPDNRIAALARKHRTSTTQIENRLRIAKVFLRAMMRSKVHLFAA